MSSWNTMMKLWIMLTDIKNMLKTVLMVTDIKNMMKGVMMITAIKNMIKTVIMVTDIKNMMIGVMITAIKNYFILMQTIMITAVVFRVKIMVMITIKNRFTKINILTSGKHSMNRGKQIMCQHTRASRQTKRSQKIYTY